MVQEDAHLKLMVVKICFGKWEWHVLSSRTNSYASFVFSYLYSQLIKNLCILRKGHNIFLFLGLKTRHHFEECLC